MPTTLKSKVFQPEQFTPTEFDTKEDKAKFANHFVKFVLSGFSEKKFPNWFYKRLSMCFGHIAHYNKNGFYDTWFENSDKQIAFIQNAQKYNCPGSSAFTYSDVERAIIDWINDEGRGNVVEAIRNNLSQEKERAQQDRKKHDELQKQTHQLFKVAAKSQNTGSFGHRQYVVIAHNGDGYFIHIIPCNMELNEGDTLKVKLCDGRPQWHLYSVENPSYFKAKPEHVKEVWT